MPPKKGAAKAKTPVATAPSTPASTVVNKNGKNIPTTAAAARPRRASTAESSPPTTTGRTTNRKAVVADESSAETPKKRGPGRLPTKTNAAAAAPESTTTAARKRGRPSTQAVPDSEEPPPKRRGRPPKGGETTRAAVDDTAAAEQLVDELMDEVVAEEQALPPKRGSKGKVRKADSASPAANTNEALNEDGKQYWLMKAEQDGHDVKLKDGSTFNTTFTIDDLRSKTEPEPWDGVRNPTAAKNMRAMRKGDLAFFYASGGKSGRKPGIVGIMEIVGEHEPDQTAFDENSAGFVEKEKDREKWCVVHVEHRKKLSKPVLLSRLQKFSKPGGALSAMQEFNAARLSVSKVSQEEWTFIVDNLIEGYADDGEGVAGAYVELPNGPRSPGLPDGVESTENPANDVAAESAAVADAQPSVAADEKPENGEEVVPGPGPSTESLATDGPLASVTSDTALEIPASSSGPPGADDLVST